MRIRPVRLALVLLAIAAVAGAGYFAFGLEQRVVSLREADRLFAEDTIRLQATLGELRAAQAGYLATGQDTAVWIGKVQQLRQQADVLLERLTRAGTGQETELGTLAESLASFARFDERIQAVLRDEQPIAASTLIFRDSAQLLSTAGHSLSTIRGAQAAAAGAAVVQLQRQAGYAAAGAGTIVLLALLLLLPARPQAPAAELQELGETPASMDVGRSLFAPASLLPSSGQDYARSDFDLALPPRETGRAIDLAAESRSSHRAIDVAAEARETATEMPLRSEPPFASVEPRRSAPIAEHQSREAPVPVDLAAAARLCTDLARVHDTSELQGLLARTATLLGASGIVVWMGSEKGDVLWPAFSHGYSPHAMARMQALPRDGATPVSAAYRKGLMEVVPASDGASGAIVAPIITANGCVGAMAVEVAASGETSDGAQALASIVAAQLATLVGGEQG